MRLINNTQGTSKIGYVVKIDPRDPNSFIYATASDAKIIGIVAESVPYRQLCEVITSGTAKVFVASNVTKGATIRNRKSTDRISNGATTIVKTGDAPYTQIGTALSDGKGLVSVSLSIIFFFGTAETDPLSLHINGDNSPSSDISWNNKKITDLADPTLNQDAVTKIYVDEALAQDEYLIQSRTVTRGTEFSGTYLNSQSQDDGLEWVLREQGGAVGLNIECNFTGINLDRKFTRIYIHGWYDDGAAEIQIQLWDYNSSTWEVYDTFIATNSLIFKTILVTDSEDHTDGGGNAKIRFYQTAAGATNRYLHLDYVALVKQGFGGTTTDHGGLSGLQDDDHNTLYPRITFSRPTAVINTATTPYNVTATDVYIFIDATAGNKVVNLPLATGSARIITVKKIAGAVLNTVTITADATGTADLIDGAATVVLSTLNTSVTIQDAIANTWYII